jgi:hypothetical protein
MVVIGKADRPTYASEYPRAPKERVMRGLALVAVLVAAPALAQDVTGSIPRTGAGDASPGPATRLLSALPQFPAAPADDRFAPTALGPYRVTTVKQLDARLIPARLLSARLIGARPPWDVAEAASAR